MRGSNSIRIAVARADGESRYSTTADESVIEPPKPTIDWKLRDGSTTTVGTVGWARANWTLPIGASLSVPSAVVSHTCTAGLAF